MQLNEFGYKFLITNIKGKNKQDRKIQLHQHMPKRGEKKGRTLILTLKKLFCMKEELNLIK